MAQPARRLFTTQSTVPPRRDQLLGYDSEAKKFRIIFFSTNGPFTEEGNRYQGGVAEGKLTFEGTARFQYELDDEGKIKMNADGTISVAWWLRDEQGEWKPWMENTFTMVKD